MTETEQMQELLSFGIAAPQNDPEVINLLNESFRTPVGERTWDWYVHGNPYGTTRVYLALERARQSPVGLFAFTPVTLVIRGEPMRASAGHHLCLKPAYRGGRHFTGLSRHALKGEAAEQVRLALGLPNRRSYEPQKILMKWSDFSSLECLYKPLTSAAEHRCRELDRFGPDFDRFYAHITRGLDFCIQKSADWMNWRFHDRPDSPYTVYVCEDSSALAGYVVLKQWRDPDGYSKAHIVDLHALDHTCLSHLVAAAETYAAGCQELNLWAIQGYPYRDFLEQRGFMPRDSARQPLIAKMLDGCALTLPNGPASFSYADGDFVY